MLRGTRVAQAYIAVTADGSDINKDISDAFDDIDYDEFGDRFGARVADSLRGHLRSLDRDFSGVIDRMGRAIETDNRLTDGIRKQLANAFDLGELDRVVAEVGRRAGVEFGDGFDREMNRAVLDSLEKTLTDVGKSSNFDLSRLMRSIDSGQGQLDLPGGFLDDAVRQVRATMAESRREYENLWSDLLKGQDRMEKERAAQVRLGEQIVLGMRRDYAKQWERLLAGQEAKESRLARMQASAIAMNMKYDKDRFQKLSNMQAAAMRMNERFDADRIKATQTLGRLQDAAAAMNERRQRDYMRMLDLAHRLNSRYDAERSAEIMKIGKMQEMAHRMNAQFDAARIKSVQDLGRLQDSANRMNAKFDADRITSIQTLGRMQEQALRMNAKYNAGMLDGQGVSRNQSAGLDAVIGRMFGKGSRNNALNLIGSTMGNVVSLTEKAGKFASGFADGMNNAAQGASMVSRLMSGFSGGAQASGMAGIFTRLGASAPMLIASLAVVVIMLSSLASVAGALVGIITALASTIASALVGALLVLAPALGAVVAAGGLLVAAFTSMTNAQINYLKTAFEPFHQAITGLGQIIMTEFTRPLYNGQSAIQVWSANLQRALVPLAGVARTTAGAFAQAGNIITASLSGPGFRMFFASLSVQLPAIVNNLARALGGFLNGVGGMFAALMPLVTRFTGYLADAASRFSAWANSAQGQNSIVDFANRAVESLKSLWGAVKEIGGFIGDVLFSPVSQRAGNSIFDSIADTFADFRRSFAKNVANGNIERWFNDAIQFGATLWGVMKSLWKVFLALYNSGVLEGVGGGLEALAGFMELMGIVLRPLVDGIGAFVDTMSVLPSILDAVLGPIDEIIGRLMSMAGAVLGVTKAAAASSNALSAATAAQPTAPGGIIGPWAPGTEGNPVPYIDMSALDSLISTGENALNNTFEQYGGHMPDPSTSGSTSPSVTYNGEVIKQDWVNPYKDWAKGVVDEAARLAKEIRSSAREAKALISGALDDITTMLSNLISDAGESMTAAVTEAAMSTDYSSVVSSFNTLIEQFASSTAVADAMAQGQATVDSAVATSDQMVASAQAAYDAAAQAVASASTPKELSTALANLQKADDNLSLAIAKGRDIIETAEAAARQMVDAAEASQQQLNYANSILNVQATLNMDNVLDLINGVALQNASLADYAEARRIVAERLASANEQLASAIALRDNYSAQVADGVKNFATLLGAQAKTIAGVEQALTARDITDNLQARLAKIKTFQENLRLLLASGLSNDAYKQLVDAGVEGGSAYAQALVDGGQGSISEVNSLVSQIGSAAGALGDAAASQMYQAGVDAAQGLVDGLESLSSQLGLAAWNLGNQVALAIKQALGIASPSKVAYGLMLNGVGDGMVNGLDAAATKVDAASARLSSHIMVSPEVAAYEAQVRLRSEDASANTGVSGNGTDQRPIDLTIVTPTEDPHAVATEVINELTGRL